MQYNPTLIVTRLVVTSGTNIVYDEKFHSGINVIRGENSSGKSTVLDLIFYGLGGDLSEWSGAARKCDLVYLEAKINNSYVTFCREISQKIMQPMEIFGGNYELSVSSSRNSWKKFPYTKARGMQSFSQAIFELMGMPEVETEISGNITMNQLLRLLYADQLSPIEEIFRSQNNDRADLRDSVGRLLCGAFDNEIYSNQMEIRRLEKRLVEIRAELKSLENVLISFGNFITLNQIESEKDKLLEEEKFIEAKLIRIHAEAFSNDIGEQVELGRIETLLVQFQDANSKLNELEEELAKTSLMYSDSKNFVDHLHKKLEALNDSTLVADTIGEINFTECPACFATIEETENIHACHLCKSPFDRNSTRSRISGLIIDTKLQITQSALLQERREKKLQALNSQVAEKKILIRALQEQISKLRQIPTNKKEELLRDIYTRLGYIERQMEDLESKKNMIGVYESLDRDRVDLAKRSRLLEVKNNELLEKQETRLKKAYHLISMEVKTFLINDLNRQDAFENPQKVTFSFAGNNVAVDGEKYFSASSRAILKSSFIFGLMAAATKDSEFRHPRFCMIDTHENMGVETIRSQNFQIQMLEFSKSCEVEHQIIYATAMIAPELDEEEFVVGSFSTADNKTIHGIEGFED